METLDEEVEEYSWRDVVLPALVPVVQEPVELERESRQRRRGRDILVAVDHGPNSQHALHWALAHLCRLADTLHFVHVVHSRLFYPSSDDEVVYDVSKRRMDELAVEAFQIAMVRSQGRIVEGEAGKMICREAERLKPAAVVMGTRGRGRIQSVLQGSVSEYCFRHCKAAPVIIVPGKEAGDRSVF
ncbi:Universal stress protein family [Musa troglodytarum]|uniref:Universal stress protein family n=1 Tax=Musa troglodytarum TaxID=320322 RepID=A0A9E7KEB2_9LILI|nr:Universal stress protein family [Musa troglodytarum]